jgi:glycosyltransferase involved in cell wall biosynthesis
MRERVPWALRGPVRRTRNAAAQLRLALRALPRWRAISRTPARRDGVAVSYGVDRMPGLDEVSGGHVKFALLAQELPNAARDFNVVYLGSSSMPLDAWMLARLAGRRGASLVWNQNGVAYPGWYGDGWELVNRPRSRLFHAADHVLFQSAFCKVSADRFYGERQGPWEVLHNPVDTRRFTPPPAASSRPLTLLLGGSQYQRYRFEAALATLAELDDARLLVSGSLSWAPDAERDGRALVATRGLEERVELLGPYAQSDAPDLIRRADVLLNTKYNDPCPTIVLEAMACGLPVVYSASGGVPELVGDDAGVGIPAPLDWERDHPPAPEALAAAVRTVAERLPERAAAARERALEFDARRWIARHVELFEELRGRA